jgi:hypothetical protein
VRLDLGPAVIARTRNKTPSGWVNAGNDVHYCPMCAPRVDIDALLAAAASVEQRLV